MRIGMPAFDDATRKSFLMHTSAWGAMEAALIVTDAYLSHDSHHAQTE